MGASLVASPGFHLPSAWEASALTSLQECARRKQYSMKVKGAGNLWRLSALCERHWLLLPSRSSRVRLCATPRTAAHQAPPSLEFSRQEHWSRLPLPSPNVTGNLPKIIQKPERILSTQRPQERLSSHRKFTYEVWELNTGLALTPLAVQGCKYLCTYASHSPATGKSGRVKTKELCTARFKSEAQKLSRPKFLWNIWNKNMKRTSNDQIQHPFNIKETEAQDSKWSYRC